ncbi:MAG TPA: BON domain-containing protein [Polyangiaceae bacterium]
MKRSFGPLLTFVIAVACSNNRPAESADSTMVEAATDEPNFTPASDTTRNEASPDAREPARNDTATAVPGDATPAARDTIPPPAAGSTGDTRSGDAAPPDNTKVNERDRNKDALTPIDQSESAPDLKITQEIRKAVMADGSLSFTAKNVKIITNNGKVTLRGPVKSASERAAIDAAARKVAGAGKVDNQLEIVQ